MKCFDKSLDFSGCDKNTTEIEPLETRDVGKWMSNVALDAKNVAKGYD